MWKIDHIYSEFYEGILEDVGLDGNKVFEDGLFRRGRDVVHGVLELMKGFGFMMLNVNLLVIHIVFYLLFYIPFVLSSTILYCNNFALMRYIPEVKSGFILVIMFFIICKFCLLLLQYSHLLFFY